MKPSSVSLIATALAAIAGSSIAAPGPLHARALEDVNSFSERDVDVYSRESGLALLEHKVDGGSVDNLFIRASIADGCRQAAAAHDTAEKHKREAARKARGVAEKAEEAASTAREAARKARLIAHDARVVHHNNLAHGIENLPALAAIDGYTNHHLHHYSEARRYTTEAQQYADEGTHHDKEADEDRDKAAELREDASCLSSKSANSTQKERARKWYRKEDEATKSGSAAVTRSSELDHATAYYQHLIDQKRVIIDQYNNHPAIAEQHAAAATLHHLHLSAHQANHGG